MRLKNLKVTTAIISKLRPCESRFENWKSHYDTFAGDVIDFLSLDQITARDKIWVCLQILPRDLVETHAVNSAFNAVAYPAATAAVAYPTATDADAAAADASDAATAADAAAAAAYAFDAAYAAAAAAAAAMDAEREQQVDALIYLINEYENN